MLFLDIFLVLLVLQNFATQKKNSNREMTVWIFYDMSFCQHKESTGIIKAIDTVSFNPLYR